MKAFTGVPFFRICIPFILGIVAGIRLEWSFPALLYCSLLFIPLAFFNFYRPGSRSFIWLFMICADVFLFFYGTLLVQQNDISKQENYYGSKVNSDTVVTFIASIHDLPVEKEKFIKCQLELKEILTDKGFKATRGTVLGYFKRSVAATSLKAGQTVLVKANLMEVMPPKNPFEFNYRDYLSARHIYHTAFVDSTRYAVLPVEEQLNAVWKLGLSCKAFLLERLEHSALSKDAYGICAALLTGYDDEIDKSVMDAFSHSGTLHVLSVSGLHTGLIYLALNFLFDFLDRKKRYKLARLIFITVFLWFFALVTGFSAPVLRAVIMFNLLGFGKIYFRARYRHQLNILLVSAFILLVYNPFYILDIGFLLSYFALFGLIYFQPALTALWHPENKFLDSIWQSVTASTAATISTLPITLFCFKQFPLWFFVCNAVVVPATFLLLLLAVFVVLKINVVSILVNYLVSFLVWFINLFNSGTYGFIDNIHFTLTDVLFLSLFSIMLSVAFQYRSYRFLSMSLVLLILWQFTSLLTSYAAKNETLLTVYNIKKESVASVKNKTLVSVNHLDASAYNYSIRPHLNSFNYATVKEAKFNAVKKEKQFIVFLDKPGFWPKVDLSQVTTLILANNFKLQKHDLQKFKNLKMLVSDASNNNYTAAKAEELSRNFGISFYNTKQQGAYLLALP